MLKVLIEEKTDELDLAQIPAIHSDQIAAVTVPRYPALTKEQFLVGRALWPITYHPATPPPKLTAEEKERYVSVMRHAIELGHQAYLKGNLPVGMVILDSQGQIIGECGDNRKEMYLDHCCFAGIRVQSERLRSQLGGRRASKDDPYLCTNCDIVITREPCIMCCMCLLHSRVRRVIYGCDDINGGLKSHIHLHYKEKLNHHFRVFRGVLEKECASLWDEREDDSICFV